MDIKTKIQHLLSLPRLLALVALGVLIALGLLSPLGAEPTALTQGYNVDKPLQKGMIVRLKDGDATKVEPLSSGEIENMHGVVVNANDAPITLSGEGQKVFVATTGTYEVLVSTQNGPIKVGDLVTVSGLHGVGMRAGSEEAWVLGRAVTAFETGSTVLGTAEVKSSDGTSKSVQLGRVAVDITVARNPLVKATQPNLPEFLQKATETIAGKPVDAPRAYMALVVFIVTTSIAASLLYGGVRSGIISIGRNPLSKKMVSLGMMQVVLAGLIIFIIGLFGVYLLLKL